MKRMNVNKIYLARCVLFQLENLYTWMTYAIKSLIIIFQNFFENITLKTVRLWFKISY